MIGSKRSEEQIFFIIIFGRVFKVSTLKHYRTVKIFSIIIFRRVFKVSTLKHYRTVKRGRFFTPFSPRPDCTREGHQQRGRLRETEKVVTYGGN
jgi:hypothetical protein